MWASVADSGGRPRSEAVSTPYHPLRSFSFFLNVLQRFVARTMTWQLAFAWIYLLSSRMHHRCAQWRYALSSDLYWPTQVLLDADPGYSLLPDTRSFLSCATIPPALLSSLNFADARLARCALALAIFMYSVACGREWMYIVDDFLPWENSQFFSAKMDAPQAASSHPQQSVFTVYAHTCRIPTYLTRTLIPSRLREYLRVCCRGK